MLKNFPSESFCSCGFGSPYGEILFCKEIAFTILLMCSWIFWGKWGCVKDAMLTFQKVMIWHFSIRTLVLWQYCICILLVLSNEQCPQNTVFSSVIVQCIVPFFIDTFSHGVPPDDNWHLPKKKSETGQL